MTKKQILSLWGHLPHLMLAAVVGAMKDAKITIKRRKMKINFCMSVWKTE